MKGAFKPIMAVSLLHDAAAAALAMGIAIYVRYFAAGDPLELQPFVMSVALYTLVSLSVFARLGVYRGLWRYTSFQDLGNILKAVTFATLIFVPLMFIVSRLDFVPRGAVLIQWPIAVGLMVFSRVLYRAIVTEDLFFPLRTFGRLRDAPFQKVTSILLVGPAENVDHFVREAGRLGAQRFPYLILGIVDVDDNQLGAEIRRLRILGHVSEIGAIIETLRRQGRTAEKVVITGGVEGKVARRLFDECERLGLPLARTPRLTDLHVSDGVPINIQPVDIRDLLGRSQKALDRDAMRRFVSGKRVLVTGAGGTIGSELTRQIAQLKPERIAVLDYSEFNLYEIDLEIKERFAEQDVASIFGDVRERDRLEAIVRDFKPDIVFHAAAMKHVPIVEEHVSDGVLTNVYGSMNVADACVACGVPVMVMISTDKAVNPSSIMGATKRVAELHCQALARKQDETRFVIVRFGNVIGSTGSVVPLFQRQIAHGGPVTVTDAETTRYFMTTKEAVELVLSAASAELPGSDLGHVHVLDMGDPIKIDDLARRMIRLAGLKPGEDVEIKYTGLRAGEKLHEVLFHDQEELQPTPTSGVMMAAARVIDYERLEPSLEALIAAATNYENGTVLRILRTLVPEYVGDDATPLASTDHTPEKTSMEEENRVRSLNP